MCLNYSIIITVGVEGCLQRDAARFGKGAFHVFDYFCSI